MSTGTHPGKSRLLLAAATIIGLGLAAAGPAAAAGENADPGLRALCAQVADRPPGGAELTTDPPPGAPLRAGQTVAVTLRWDEPAFAGPDLARVAHCVVTLDGRLRLDLSAAEAPSPNDGEYRGSFVVPADLVPGDCLCVLGVASGESPDGGPTRLGGSSCVTVTKPAPPATPPPTTPSAPPAGPPDRPSATVLPATQTAPPDVAVAPASQAMPLPLTELPRTGPSDARILLLAAGMAFVVGGGAQLFPRRKQAARR
jgi:hypothetical protein